MLPSNILERLPTKFEKGGFLCLASTFWTMFPYMCSSLRSRSMERDSELGCFNTGCLEVLKQKSWDGTQGEFSVELNIALSVHLFLKCQYSWKKSMLVLRKEKQRWSIPCLLYSKYFIYVICFTLMTVLWRIMFSSFCTSGCFLDERFAHLSRIAQPIAVKATFRPMSVKTLYFFSLFSWHSQDCSGYLITAQRWRRGPNRKAKKASCA